MRTFLKCLSTAGMAMTAVVAFGHIPTASACTGIMLEAEDGTSVYGRTMEWGAFDLHSRVVVVPRGAELAARMPDGAPGAQWTSRYGVVAIDGLNQPYALDGLNEKGLTTGALIVNSNGPCRLREGDITPSSAQFSPPTG